MQRTCRCLIYGSSKDFSGYCPVHLDLTMVINPIFSKCLRNPVPSKGLSDFGRESTQNTFCAEETVSRHFDRESVATLRRTRRRVCRGHTTTAVEAAVLTETFLQNTTGVQKTGKKSSRFVKEDLFCVVL